MTDKLLMNSDLRGKTLSNLNQSKSKFRTTSFMKPSQSSAKYSFANVFSCSTDLLSSTGSSLQQPKPKSIDLTKHFSNLRSPITFSKELDIYSDPRKNHELMVIENAKLQMLNQKYSKEHLRKLCQLLKNKDKMHSKYFVVKTVASLDKNHNLYLTLQKFGDKGESHHHGEHDWYPNKDFLEQKLIYKYDKINTKQFLAQERRAYTQFNKIIPEFVDGTLHSSSEDDDEGLKSKRIQEDLDNTDSTVLEDCDKTALFRKIHMNNSTKSFSLTKPKFDNGKKLVVDFRSKTEAGEVSNAKTHLSTNNINTVTSMSGSNNQKKNLKFTNIFSLKKKNVPKEKLPILIKENHKSIANHDKYSNSVENIKRLTHNLQFIRKANPDEVEGAKKKKQGDLYKFLKEADSMVDRIVKLDVNRGEKMVDLKRKVEVEKNRFRIKIV